MLYRPTSIRAVLTALAIVFVTFCASAHPLNIPGAQNTHVGIYIEDLKTGHIVADINSADIFTPASVMKSLTAASVLNELVPDGRFITPVHAVGRVTDGVLDGNVVVMTVGDPTIESRHFERNLGFADSIASALKRAGIQSVKGTVIVDETYFVDATVPAGWDKADLSQSYGTVLRAGCWRGNASGKAAVTNPSAEMKREIITAINNAGIEVRQEQVSPDRDVAMTLYAHTSPRVDEILRSLMVRSDNLMAEGMLRTLEPGKPRKDAINYEVDLWKRNGLDFDGIVICDGSGLSRHDRLSPRFMAAVYKWMYKSPLRVAYSNLFPRAGQDGTMRNFMKHTRLEGRLAMKTGSMNGVQGFGGYMLDSKGEPTHVIVVFVNGFTCSRDRLKGEIARYLLDTLP